MTRSAGLVFMVPTRFVEWLHQVTTGHPERHVLVLIPELVHRRWYQFLVNHRATRLKAQLLLKGGPHVSVMSTPWYPDLRPVAPAAETVAQLRPPHTQYP